MAQRTTTGAVQALGNFPASLDLQPFIDTAVSIVDDIEALGDSCMNAAKLELVERWLSAHFASMLSPMATSKSIAGASMSFEGVASGQGIASTRFGVQAMVVDCTGHLRRLENGPATMQWLGTSYENS